MIKLQAQRKLEATSETIADYDATINKFRDLVSSLQVSEGKYECITDGSFIKFKQNHIQMSMYFLVECY